MPWPLAPLASYINHPIKRRPVPSGFFLLLFFFFFSIQHPATCATQKPSTQQESWSFPPPPPPPPQTHTRTHARTHTRTHARIYTHARTHARTHAHTRCNVQRLPPPTPTHQQHEKAIINCSDSILILFIALSLPPKLFYAEENCKYIYICTYYIVDSQNVDPNNSKAKSCVQNSV